MEKLVSGKRYWFKSGNYVYSGLFGGEIDEWGAIILRQRNGNEWAIPLEDIYATEKEAQDNTQNHIVRN